MFDGDFDAMDGDELVDALVAEARAVAASEARQLRIVAALRRHAAGWLDDGGPCPVEEIRALAAAEIAPALVITRSAALDLVDLADAVTGRLTPSLDALAAGSLTLSKLRAIADHTEGLDDDGCARVQARVLPDAAHATPPTLRARLARAVLEVDPAGAARRREDALAGRRVAFYPREDSMAALFALLPGADAQRGFRWLTEAAWDAAVDGDENSLDQRRADILVDLLLGRTTMPPADEGPEPAAAPETRPGQQSSEPTARATADTDPTPVAPTHRRPRWESRPATVHVTVAWTTLAGLDEQAGHLAGYGPISADQARELAGDATWRRLLTDPESGTVLDLGTTTYAPPAALARHVRTRDSTCRFPGCRQPAERCDLDHTVPFPHGPTAETNLAAVCRGHHRRKTFSQWRLRWDPDGNLVWTSPTRHIYRTTPADLPLPTLPIDPRWLDAA